MLNAFLPWLRSGSAGVTALGALGLLVYTACVGMLLWCALRGLEGGAAGASLAACLLCVHHSPPPPPHRSLSPVGQVLPGHIPHRPGARAAGVAPFQR